MTGIWAFMRPSVEDDDFEDEPCKHKNKATSAVRIRGKFRTYCLDCKQEIDEKSRIAQIFEEMERLL